MSDFASQNQLPFSATTENTESLDSIFSILVTSHTPNRKPVILSTETTTNAGTNEIQEVRIGIIAPRTRPPVAITADITLRARVDKTSSI